MKAILEFDLEDFNQRREHLRAVHGTDLAMAFEAITQRVFRPARKHGYPEYGQNERKLRELMDGPNGDLVAEIIGTLEQLHSEVIREEGIEFLLGD